MEGIGIKESLQTFIDLVPKPTDHTPYAAKNDADEDIEVTCDANGSPAALIFKTVADQVLGKISFAKIISGTFKSGQEAYNVQSEKAEKLGTMFFL